MEILDKGKIKIAYECYNNLKERFFRFFRIQPKENIGVYISEDYVYFVSIFCDSDNWHLLYFDKEKIPPFDYEELAATWIKNMIDKYNLKGAVITLEAPDKFLLKREVTLKNIPDENLKETIYWDFALNYFNENQDFSVAYYPVDEGAYFAAALQEKHRNYIDEIFKKKDIVISGWTLFPPQIQLNINGSCIYIFEKNLKVPADVDMTKLNEYSHAIYAAMAGANLFKGEENISFNSSYSKESWNWRLISIFIFILGFFIFVCVFFYDNYKIYSLQNELNTLNSELQNLSLDKTRLNIYNDILNDTKMRESFIAEKTTERFPFAGVILHLGTFTTDGVVLTSVKSDGNTVIIEGEADTKEDMEEFLEKINESNDIFIKSPKSLRIDNKDKVKFSFSINL